MKDERRSPTTERAWPRPTRDRLSDPFELPRPRFSGPQCSGHLEMPQDALAYQDYVLRFHDLDPETLRWRWLDSLRHGANLRLSWVRERSFLDPVQTWRHTRVRYALDHIVLRAGATLELETPFGDPVELYAHRVSMQSGARILIRGGEATLGIGQLVGLRSDQGDLPEILITSEDGCGGDAGRSGKAGIPGTRDITGGLPGQSGTDGSVGLNGAPLQDCAVSIHTMTGHAQLTVRPGRGGDGGAGGRGGAGGQGGTVAFFGIGEGGQGGAGGDGGAGGAGGDAGGLRLDLRRCSPGSNLVVDITSGQGGAGGAAGARGPGGPGAPDGRSGALGNNGIPGRNGSAPTVEWLNRAEAGQ